jgi:hypothetical protein
MAEEMNRNEKIGFHKGAIDTLLKERQELLKMASIVTKILEMHVAGLKEMGIDITQQLQQAQQAQPQQEAQPQTQQPQTQQPQTQAQPQPKKKDDNFDEFY